MCPDNQRRNYVNTKYNKNGDIASYTVYRTQLKLGFENTISQAVF